MCTKTSTTKVETATTMDTIAVDDNAISLPTKAKKLQRLQIRTKNTRANNNNLQDSYTFLGERISDEETPFWTSPVLIVQYVIIIAAIVSRRLWVLQGILVVLGACIAIIVYNWVCYILKDPELNKAVASMRWYFGFAMRQAEATVKGGNARRMLEGGVLAWRGTAQSFLKWFYRQRSAHVNQVMLQQRQMNIDRLKQWQEKMKSGKLSIQEKMTRGR